MARNIVTKLEVDLLVQAAVYGPMGAASWWSPLTKDPDALGEQLLSYGRRSSRREGESGYRFTPLPIGLTPVEVIKACQHYRYKRTRVPAIINRLVDHMAVHLDGWSEAPWGWSVDHVEARRDRPAPGSDSPAPPPRALTDVAERLEAAGWEADKIVEAVSSIIGTKAAYWAPEGLLGALSAFHEVLRADQRLLSRCYVVVSRNAEDAKRSFAWAIGATRSAEVRRVDNLVVVSSHAPTGSGIVPETAEALDRLGPVDDLWSEYEPPVVSGVGEKVAEHTPMALPSTLVITTKPELERLLSTLHDPGVIDKLRRIDLREQSVLVAPDLEIGELQRVELVRGAVQDGPARMTEDLVLVHEPSDAWPTKIGTIVAIPRMRRRPFYVKVATTEMDRHFVWQAMVSSFRSMDAAQGRRV